MDKMICSQCGKELELIDKEVEYINEEKCIKHSFECENCDIKFNVTITEKIGIEEDERFKENRETTFNDLRENCYSNDLVTDLEIAQHIQEDYNDLIDLRNRIANGTDEDTELFEEDHITLDHTLDYLERFIELINIKNILKEN